MPGRAGLRKRQLSKPARKASLPWCAPCPSARHAADLGQCLDEQRPRHDRVAGKVPLEAVGVVGYVVNHAHGPLPVLDPLRCGRGRGTACGAAGWLGSRPGLTYSLLLNPFLPW